MIKTGRVWKFGDDISTDLISPGRYIHLRTNLPELAKHTFEDINPEFSKKVKAGDFVVAGKNFGLGSSREHAACVLKILGISAVIAKSFARIFYRNAINIGLVVLECDSDKIDDGDILELNLEEGILFNKTKSEYLSFSPLPKVMLNILKDGGLIEHIKKHRNIIIS